MVPHFDRLQSERIHMIARQRDSEWLRLATSFGWAVSRLSRRIKQTGDLVRSFGACSCLALAHVFGFEKLHGSP